MASLHFLLAACILLWTPRFAIALPPGLRGEQSEQQRVPTARTQDVPQMVPALAIPCSDIVCDKGFEPAFSFGTDSCFCQAIEEPYQVAENIIEQRQVQNTAPRGPSVNASTLKFVPPPQPDITAQLLNESLALQPQNTATIASAVLYSQQGVISYLVQLTGFIAGILTMNTSTAFPCGTIRAGNSPGLMLVPQAMQDATPQSTIADCVIIAINMYNPQTIDYWVQDNDGSVYNLTGDDQIHDLNKINTTAGTALSILTSDTASATKRGLKSSTAVIPLRRRQIYRIECDSQCPFYHMSVLKGSDGYCGCVFRSANESLHTRKRGLVAPTAYTSMMTEAACKAITCTQNGGKPAVYNSFSLTCWCNTPEYVQITSDSMGAPTS